MMQKRPGLQAGLSMVELMVAVVISLIGTIVIFQVFQVNESIRRETTNGADTQTSGLVALTTIERDLRIAGFGFNDEDLIGCDVTMYDMKRTPKDVAAFKLVPIKITAGTGTVPDTLQVTYGTPSITPARVTVSDAIVSATSNLPFTPNQTYGFTPGDVVLLWEIGKACSVVEVTAVNADQVSHDAGNFFNPLTGQTEQSRFNKSTGHGNDYSGNPATQVSNLGQTPVMNVYTVRNDTPATPHENNQLTVNNNWAEIPSDFPIAEQIVHFKAEYGLDNGVSNNTVVPRDLLPNDGIVDQYTTTHPADWSQVVAVRLAVVTRSIQPERPDPSTGTCNITPDWGDPNYPIVWARGPDATSGRAIDVRTQTDWRCYRYRVFESTVPLRNMLWRKEAL